MNKIDSPHSETDLSRIYAQRFSAQKEYRKNVWATLIRHYFSSLVPEAGSVLDLGCGYGEFINQISADRKYAMDLNPDAPSHLEEGINFLHQDCSMPWPVAENSLDVVFTSNFFEHLPDKAALGRTLDQTHRALKAGGCLIAIGPNARHLAGEYWDFWDHHIPLSELSLSEALSNRDFQIERCIAKFLPYTMTRRTPIPQFLVATYVHMPVFWPLFGKQFLVVARKSI
jgi:SAM-dependent methyltransferase